MSQRVAGQTRRPMPVAEFLRRCALAVPSSPGAAEAFLAGGRAALRATASGEVWRQVNLALDGPPAPAVYRAVSDLVRGALDDGLVGDAFFVHKSPGIRLRLRTDVAALPALDAETSQALQQWRGGGLVRGWHASVYEPELSLFGGPVSMRSVHRLFTADSLAWAGFHGLPAPAQLTWPLSLLMVRGLLAELGVVGWEDRGVWQRLREDAGRTVTDETRRTAAMTRLAAALRHHWDHPEDARRQLAPEAARLLDEYTASLRVLVPRWSREYFTADGAVLGPRTVAAHTIVFHWNRAGLPAHHQALLVEALALPPGGTRTWSTS